MAAWIKTNTLHKTNNTVILDAELNLDHIDFMEKAATNSDNTRVYANSNNTFLIAMSITSLRQHLKESNGGWITVNVLSKSSNKILDAELNINNVALLEKAATNSNNTRIFTTGGHTLLIAMSLDKLRDVYNRHPSLT